MLGWFSDASTVASRLKRARRSASCANARGSVLSATSRPSFVSCARKTSPMPPAPSDDTTSYGPSRVPGCSVMVELDYIADRKSTRLNSSHLGISYAVFCLKKKKQQKV